LLLAITYAHWAGILSLGLWPKIDDLLDSIADVNELTLRLGKTVVGFTSEHLMM